MYSHNMMNKIWRHICKKKPFKFLFTKKEISKDLQKEIDELKNILNKKSNEYKKEVKPVYVSYSIEELMQIAKKDKWKKILLKDEKFY